jgi:hypothetical protein
VAPAEILRHAGPLLPWGGGVSEVVTGRILSWCLCGGETSLRECLACKVEALRRHASRRLLCARGLGHRAAEHPGGRGNFLRLCCASRKAVGPRTVPDSKGSFRETHGKACVGARGHHKRNRHGQDDVRGALTAAHPRHCRHTRFTTG